MLTLVVEDSSGPELTYRLDKQVISVGASATNDVVIRSPGVAPKHLIFQRGRDVLTFVAQRRQVVVLNGERRTRGVMRAGDRVRLGTATVTVKELEGGGDDKTGETSAAAAVRPVTETPQPAVSRQRSEVVLYTERARLSAARVEMARFFRDSVFSEAKLALTDLMASIFPDRRSMLARLDQEGRFRPLISNWVGESPCLPARTFEELSHDGRFALLRLGSQQFLIFPVERRVRRGPVYLAVEVVADGREDDEILLAELACLLNIHWARVERSDVLYREWEESTRMAVEKGLPGTSQGVRALRTALMAAARSSQPVLVGGRPGGGRSWVANLVASRHPEGGSEPIVFQARDGCDADFRIAFFGSESEQGSVELLDRFSWGTAVVVRDIHLFSTALQKELASVIEDDLDRPFGPSLRWMATTVEHVAEQVDAGRFEASLFQLFRHHLLSIPPFEERREDLALVVVGLIESISTELSRDVRGIDLATLGALMNHPFDGQMTELLRELRRMVGGTPQGEVLCGSVSTHESLGLSAVSGAEYQGSTDLLDIDDLKTVIPGVEKMIIDRVLQRTLGNQSRAARELNLSRGALIAKMKEYEIPDYRYLRQNK